MAQKAKAPVRVNIREAFMEEAMKIVAGVAAEQGIQILPDEVVKKLAGIIPERVLQDNDARLRYAAILGTVLGATGMKSSTREAIENFWTQGAEEIGKISTKLNADNPEETRKAIRGELEKKKGGLIAALRGDKDQGDKVQKRAMPDYFTAKGAMKDDELREKLSKIELAFQKSEKDLVEKAKKLSEDAKQKLADPSLKLSDHEKKKLEEDARKGHKDMFIEFMSRGAFRIQTTPEELIDIAKTSEGPNHEYGIMRLKSLMNGQRGEGSTKSKVKSIAEDLLEQVLSAEESEDKGERLSRNLDNAIDKLKKHREDLKNRI